jgi:hypothetical protein
VLFNGVSNASALHFASKPVKPALKLASPSCLIAAILPFVAYQSAYHSGLPQREDVRIYEFFVNLKVLISMDKRFFPLRLQQSGQRLNEPIYVSGKVSSTPRLQLLSL